MVVCLASGPAVAQFGPQQVRFRNAVRGWTGTIDIHSVGSATVTGPAGASQQSTSDLRVRGRLTLNVFDPLTGSWAGVLDGTITVSEQSLIAFACTVENSFSASTSAGRDFRGQPLVMHLSLDIGSDTWSLSPSSNQVMGLQKSVQTCAGQAQTSSANVPMAFMAIGQKMGLPFPATGYDLKGTQVRTCGACSNANSGDLSTTITYDLKAVLGAVPAGPSPRQTAPNAPPGLPSVAATGAAAGSGGHGAAAAGAGAGASQAVQGRPPRALVCDAEGANLQPDPGKPLPGGTVEFSWMASETPLAFLRYVLQVGRQRGGADIYDGAPCSCTKQTVSGLPVDGSTLWVRLSARAGSRWYCTDVAYHAARR